MLLYSAAACKLPIGLLVGHHGNRILVSMPSGHIKPASSYVFNGGFLYYGNLSFPSGPRLCSLTLSPCIPVLSLDP